MGDPTFWAILVRMLDMCMWMAGRMPKSRGVAALPAHVPRSWHTLISNGASSATISSPLIAGQSDPNLLQSNHPTRPKPARPLPPTLGRALKG